MPSRMPMNKAHPRPIHIVTDSHAQFTAAEAQARGVTVVAAGVQVGARLLREGIDLAHEEASELVLNGAAQYIPASVSDYADAFRRLSSHADVFSFHTARALSPAYERALEAADAFRGQSNIRVVDAGTTSIGLRFVVDEACRLAAAGRSTDEVARATRHVASRVYAAFASDDLGAEPLARWPRARSVPVRDTGAIPVFVLESGELLLLERVRSMERAIERVAEFSAEFERPAEMAILQGLLRSDAALPSLAALLREEMPAVRDIAVRHLGLPLIQSLGRHAIGVALYDASDD